MSGKDALRYQRTSGESAPFRRDGVDMFENDPSFPIVQQYVEERLVIPADSQTHARGGTTKIYINDQDAAYLGGIYLQFTASAITQGTAVAANRASLSATRRVSTKARDLDWSAYRMLDSVEIRYRSQVVYQMTAEAMIDYIEHSMSEQEANVWALLGGGHLSDEQLDERADYAQTYTVNLLAPWSRANDPSKFLPVIGLPSKIEVNIKWQTQAKSMLDVNSTATGRTISDVSILGDYYHLRQENTDALYARVIGESAGYVLKTNKIEHHHGEPFTVAVGTANSDSTIKLKVSNVRNDCYAVRVRLRYADTVDTPYQLSPSSVIPLRKLELYENGKVITTSKLLRHGWYLKTLGDMEAYLDASRSSSSPAPHADAVLAFCRPEFVQASESGSYGSYNFSSMNAPVLWVTFNNDVTSVEPFPVSSKYDDASPAAAVSAITKTNFVLHCDFYCHQIITIEKGHLKALLSI